MSTMPDHHLPAVAEDLEQLRSAADRCVFEIEQAGEQICFAPEDQKDAWETTWASRESASRDHLAYLITALVTRIEIYSDAMRLPRIQHLLDTWRRRWPESTWRDTKSWSIPEADGLSSEPLISLSPIIDGIIVLAKPTAPHSLDSALRSSLDLLEHALRSIAKICRERGVVPQKELDVQRVLDSHLEGIFRDYTKSITIPKPLVSFKPDGGVLSLRAAIECKFISSETDMKQAVHGITEDLSGYAGSSDWTRFYTLCYMTAAFAVEGQLAAALGSSGHAGSWKVIMVTGQGRVHGSNVR